MSMKLTHTCNECHVLYTRVDERFRASKVYTVQWIIAESVNVSQHAPAIGERLTTDLRRETDERPIAWWKWSNETSIAEDRYESRRMGDGGRMKGKEEKRKNRERKDEREEKTSASKKNQQVIQRLFTTPLRPYRDWWESDEHYFTEVTVT